MTEFTNKTVVCRKHHACEWCGEKIEKGESAKYRSGVNYGDFYSGHQHLECYNAMVNSEHLDEFMPYEFERGKTADASFCN
jgi:hypothetical protein